MFRVSRVSEAIVLKYFKELEIMTPLRHDCIVNLLGGCWEDGADKLSLVLELCSGGSLRGLLNKTGSEAEAITWEGTYMGLGFDTALALRYIHCEQQGDPLIHRDLKPDNIMLAPNSTGKMRAKLGDFGESRRFNFSAAKKRGGGEDAVLTMEAEENDDDVLTMASWWQ